jgi:hypothetical protein
MNKVLFFSLFLFVSSLSFYASSGFTVTNTKNNKVVRYNAQETLSDAQETKDMDFGWRETYWNWNETPLTIRYSALDSREHLERLVGPMIEAAFNGWYNRSLSRAENILVIVNQDSPKVQVWTENGDGEGVFFEQRLQ